ncbi:MAG: response regulator [Candidatus Omnitrophota bacterium]
MEKPRILSIDDEPYFTEFIKEYFEPRGYEIDVAGNGDEGLALMGMKKYDVVLLDMKMIGLDGVEIMSEIKKKDPNIKIIFITAYTDSGRTKQKILRQGAYSFVEKPIASLKSLERLVNEAAGRLTEQGGESAQDTCS